MKYLLIFFSGLLVGASVLLYMPKPNLMTTEGPAPSALRVASARVPAALASTRPEPGAVFTALPPEPLPPTEPIPADALVATPVTDQTAAKPFAVHPGGLLIPVAGIAANQLVDSFDDPRGNDRMHEAIDLMAPLKTPVFAVAEGKLVKRFSSVPGGLTLYQYDASETFAYYYGHLDSYAPDLMEGQLLKRGDLIGYVGVTGNADPGGPHLHFAVFVLGPEKHWWKGTAINPYPLFER